jgi:hypothetical protein
MLFQIDYPEISEGTAPRHRFMSAYEQKVEPPDKRWQYLLFAAEPYETIAFKIPSREVDKNESKFWTLWNKDTKQVSVYPTRLQSIFLVLYAICISYRTIGWTIRVRGYATADWTTDAVDGAGTRTAANDSNVHAETVLIIIYYDAFTDSL